MSSRTFPLGLLAGVVGIVGSQRMRVTIPAALTGHLIFGLGLGITHPLVWREEPLMLNATEPAPILGPGR